MASSYPGRATSAAGNAAGSSSNANNANNPPGAAGAIVRSPIPAPVTGIGRAAISASASTAAAPSNNATQQQQQHPSSSHHNNNITAPPAPHRSTNVNVHIQVDHHQESPFLQQLLRFSPNNNNNSGYRFSPKSNLSMTTKAAAGAGGAAGPLSSAITPPGPMMGTMNMHPEDPEHPHHEKQHQHGDDDDHHPHHHDQEVFFMDGLPILKLRQLAQSSSFFASLLYTKTELPHDALLLAKSKQTEGDFAGCLAVLEESGLLLLAALYENNNNNSSNSTSLYYYYWQALLVACKALVATEQWTVLLQLLEEACRSNTSTTTAATTTSHSSFDILQDDDVLGWQALAQSISQCTTTTTTASASSSPSHDFNQDAVVVLHPLSLVCYYRGLAYYNTGDSLRAAVYWKRAVQIDKYCHVAWNQLLSHQLVSPNQAYQLLMEHMEWNTKKTNNDNNDGDDEEWLQTLYLAAIEVTPQLNTTTAYANNNNDAAISSNAADEALAATSTSSFHSPLVAFHDSTNKHPKTTSSASTASTAEVNNNTTSCSTTRSIQSHVDAAFDKLCGQYKLGHSPHVVAMAARRAYRRYEWKRALEHCQQLDHHYGLVPVASNNNNNSPDIAAAHCAYVYAAVLTLLGHKRALFRLAHEWVEASPKAAQAWFAVGCYYYCCRRFHVAQRHFCRATRLDPNSSDAWLAFGCSFAAVDESDQALASFRAAQRLAAGEHLSLLYMGMEYVRTNHLVLAQYFLKSALQTSVGDPLCWHELGVLELLQGDYEKAIAYFQRALQTLLSSGAMENTTLSLSDCLETLQDAFWEPTVYNLGHAYRKSRQYEQAQQCFARCVSLCPNKCSTWAALAFTQHLRQDLDGAIEKYHQALSCKPDDPFSTEMLHRALREAMSTGFTFLDDDDDDDDNYMQQEDDTAYGAAATTTPTPGTSTTAASAPWSSLKDESMMSEDMESDVDMSAG